MRTKFKLDLDTLAVESFDTDASLSGVGTVRGHANVGIGVEPGVIAITNVQVDCGSWIDACPSRLGTCELTCKASCLGTCASCATCPASACPSQAPSCPTGFVCEA